MQSYTSRINFTSEVEGKINQAIWMNWSLDRTYQALVSLIGGQELTNNWVGVIEYFRLSALRMRIFAEKWMKYQTVRGGQVRFEQTKTLIPVPENLESSRALIVALEIATECEKMIEGQLRELHQLAREKNDMVTVEMCEARFIPSQLRIIRFLVGLLNTLQMNGKDQYMFERLTMQPIVKHILFLIENGQVEKMSLVNGDKFVTMLLRTHFAEVKANEWIHLNLEEQKQFEQNEWILPKETTITSEWGITTDFWSL